MQSYKVGNFNYKPIAYLTLNFTNGKEIENCVKDKYKPHIIKLKSDTLLKKSSDFFNNQCYKIKNVNIFYFITILYVI